MNNVSFVIPAYNASAFLEETVLSVINGNLESGDEIIIIDDCSTDTTWPLIQSLVENYNFIRAFQHDYNKGTAAAGRNTAIGKARHELIFALDADNLLAPDSIAKLKEHLLSKKADAAAFGELWFFETAPDNIGDRIVYPDEIELGDFFVHIATPGPSGNYMFTKQSWLRAGKYFEPTLLNQTNDSWSFAVAQVASGAKMLTLPDTYYLHRKTSNSHYMREKDRANRSISALAALLPFLDLFYPADINYIMGPARYTWFDNLHTHPLRLRDGTKSLKTTAALDKYGQSHLLVPSFYLRVKNYLLRLLK